MQNVLFTLTILMLLLIPGCSGADPAPVKNSEMRMVFESRQGIQCESPGLSIEQSASKLRKQGVAVLESFCGFQTGLAAPAVCGAPTMDIIVHSIYASDLDRAKDAGFEDVAALIDTGLGQGYEVIECDR